MAKYTVMQRFWEIDVLRGIAVLFMVTYHALFLLYFVFGWNINVFTGPLRMIGWIASTTFLVLVGLSLHLSYEKAVLHGLRFVTITAKFVRRGLGIFLMGMVVTLFSSFFVPQSIIWFGILHMIGLSIMVSPLVVRLPSSVLLGLSAMIWLAGGLIEGQIRDTSLLLPIGIIPQNFSSLDYFPLLPWFSLILVGIVLGKTLYTDYKRPFPIVTFENSKIISILSQFGSHSLVIYFLHIPVLLIIFWLLGL